jgi:hypothetical protein
VAPMVTRRQVLRWGLVGGAAVLLPGGSLLGCGDSDPAIPLAPTPAGGFLTTDELRTVTAITARIVPTDDLPGALEAGAANYIDRLLAMLPDERSPGNVFGGGPFSDRNPFPDPATGTASTRFPENDFTQFMPLTRLQLLSWRVQLLGSVAVPGADFNDALLGPTVGIRQQYRAGLADIQGKSQQLFSAAFVALTADQQDAALAAADQSFVGLVTGHALEGMFCAPEYGGNANLAGWNLIHYDGDSQPLGYSIFDETRAAYNERPNKPNSTADPDEDCTGVDATTDQFLRLLVRLASQGTPFFTPDGTTTNLCP